MLFRLIFPLSGTSVAELLVNFCMAVEALKAQPVLSLSIVGTLSTHQIIFLFHLSVLGRTATFLSERTLTSPQSMPLTQTLS